MAQISISAAGFTGFRVIREHGISVLMCVVIATGVYIVNQLILAGLAGPSMQQLRGLGGQGMMDPRSLLPVYAKAAPAYLVMFPLGLAVGGIVSAAMNRVILRPEDRGIGYFALGMDEVRQAAVQLALWLLFLSLGLTLALVVGVTAAIAKGALAAVTIITLIAGVCAFIAVGVRLSLAMPLTFDVRRFNLFGSWALTRGRFWPLLGAYALAAVATTGVSLAVSVVIVLLTAVLVLTTGGLGVAGRSEITGGGFAGITPVSLLGAAAGGLIYPIIQTPAAALYRQITGGHGPNIDEAFR